jgi:hypothetical protein
MAWTNYVPFLTIMCIVTLTFNLGSRSWHFLRSRATIVWNSVQIYKEDQELGLGQIQTDAGCRMDNTIT